MKKSGKDASVGEVSLKWFIILHLSLVVNSLQGTASKLAGQREFLSAGNIFWYCVMILLMLIFALVWQQIMKHMSLTFAFTNKPVTIIWGLIWGVTIFHEHLTWKMIVGSAIILIGIMIGVSDNNKKAGGMDGPEAEENKSGQSGNAALMTSADNKTYSGSVPGKRKTPLVQDRTLPAAGTASWRGSSALTRACIMAVSVSAVIFLRADTVLAAESGSMFSGLEKYIAVWIVSVLISSIAQVMLKVEANKPHESRLKEYLNPMVAGAYAIFFVSTILTMYALRYVPLTYSPVIEPLSYIFVPVIGVLVLKEKISKRRAAGIAVMFIGIVIFSM